MDQPEINIYILEYEYILDAGSNLIILPSPSGTHAGMRRHYYFRESFSKDYQIAMINKKSLQRMKQENEVKVLKIKEKQ